MKKIAEIHTAYMHILNAEKAELHFATVRSDWGRETMIGLADTFRTAKFIRTTQATLDAFFEACADGMAHEIARSSAEPIDIDFHDFLKRFALARGEKAIQDRELEKVWKFSDFSINKKALKSELDDYRYASLESNGYDTTALRALFNRKGDWIIGIVELGEVISEYSTSHDECVTENPDEHKILEYLTSAYKCWKGDKIAEYITAYNKDPHTPLPKVTKFDFSACGEKRSHVAHWRKISRESEEYINRRIATNNW